MESMSLKQQRQSDAEENVNSSSDKNSGSLASKLIKSNEAQFDSSVMRPPIADSQ